MWSIARATAQTTLNVLVQRINGSLNKAIAPVYAEPRPGDVKHSFASVDKAAQSIGYSPSVGFEEGLLKTIEWLKAGKGSGYGT